MNATFPIYLCVKMFHFTIVTTMFVILHIKSLQNLVVFGCDVTKLKKNQEAVKTFAMCFKTALIEFIYKLLEIFVENSPMEDSTHHFHDISALILKNHKCSRLPSFLFLLLNKNCHLL